MACLAIAACVLAVGCAETVAADSKPYEGSTLISFKDERVKMGSPFGVTAVAPSEEQARQAVEAAFAEIDRIENRISSWRADSETTALNQNAGQGAMAVSDELFGLVRRSLAVSKLTGGAFDITFAGAGVLWDFKAKPPKRPDAEARTIELLLPGMRLGFGGIGKGYAANRAVHTLKELGITGGLVNAGGDLVAFGRQADGGAWTIGLADPMSPDTVFASLDLVDQAIVTSGDYERFFEVDGVRYAHILDPRTGEPVRGLRSVSVVCPDGELADALATSVFVLGVDEGLRLVNSLRGVEALIIDQDGRLHPSKSFHTTFKQAESGAGTASAEESP